MKTLSKILILSAFLGLICTGCTNSEFNLIERSIQHQIRPADMKTQFKCSFGPLSMSTIRGIVSLTDADDVAKQQLKNIRKVQVGVYELSKKDDEAIELSVPGQVIDKLQKSGWELLVRVKERDESVVILFKELKRGKVSLYVVSLDYDEVVIVEVVGNLDHILDEALKEKHRDIKELLSFSGRNKL